MNGKEKTDIPPRDPEEATEFWKGFLGGVHNHQKEAEWITSMRKEIETIEQQDDITVTEQGWGQLFEMHAVIS